MRYHAPSRLVALTLTVIGSALIASTAAAQTSIPPPANPLAICTKQLAPAADTFAISFDGAATEAVTMVTPSGSGAVVTACNANATGWTHAFQLPASRFTVGQHTIKVFPANAFGVTSTSPVYNVTIGVAPGQNQVLAVVPL